MEQPCVEQVAVFLARHAWLPRVRVIESLKKLPSGENVGDRVWRDLPVGWRAEIDALIAAPSEEAFFDALLQLTSAAPAADFDPEPATLSAFAAQCYRLSFACFGEGSDRDTSVLPRNRRFERVGEKKRYEVSVLQRSIAQLMELHDLQDVVDVGAGQGYLAFGLLRTLPSARVLALEGSAHQVHGALSRANLEREYADGAASPADRFAVRSVFVTRDTRPYAESAPEKGYLMYSLHACGSLSEAMLQMFCADPSARVLVNIGCCYNLIGATCPAFGCDGRAPDASFPLSRRVSQALVTCAKAFSLEDDEKMIACQAPRRWAFQRQKMMQFTRRHCYRAMLQPLLNDAFPAANANSEGGAVCLGKVPNSALGCFADYATAALRTVGAAAPPVSVLEAHAFANSVIERRIALLWTLRSLLGPPIEALILLDRYEYLCEQNANAAVRLVSMLDPLKSPRHMALIVERRMP